MKISKDNFLYLLLILFLISCSRHKEYSYNRFIMGGPCEIKFYCANDKTAKEIIETIDNELVRLDSLLNYFSEKSLVSALNRDSKIEASQDITYLFILSDSVSKLTDGLFDISIAPLMEMWGFYKGASRIPDATEIERTKNLVDYQKIQIKNDSIIIPKKMKIDLGGIAQGYAADRVGIILRRHHIKSAIINIGGEVLLTGRSSQDRPWRIGIKNPRGEGIVETIELENGAVSTSGDYEKFFIIDNKRYPHIINPKTGFPALNFASVTIFAKETAFADAMATAMAIMGPEKGIRFLDSLGIRGIIYYEENGVLKRRETK